MMLAVAFSHMAFIMLRYDLSIPTLLRVFIINGCWILSDAFSEYIDMYSLIFLMSAETLVTSFLSFLILVICVSHFSLLVLLKAYQLKIF